MSIEISIVHSNSEHGTRQGCVVVRESCQGLRCLHVDNVTPVDRSGMFSKICLRTPNWLVVMYSLY